MTLAALRVNRLQAVLWRMIRPLKWRRAEGPGNNGSGPPTVSNRDGLETIRETMIVLFQARIRDSIERGEIDKGIRDVFLTGKALDEAEKIIINLKIGLVPNDVLLVRSLAGLSTGEDVVIKVLAANRRRGLT